MNFSRAVQVVSGGSNNFEAVGFVDSTEYHLLPMTFTRYLSMYLAWKKASHNDFALLSNEEVKLLRDSYNREYTDNPLCISNFDTGENYFAHSKDIPLKVLNANWSISKIECDCHT